MQKASLLSFFILIREPESSVTLSSYYATACQLQCRQESVCGLRLGFADRNLAQRLSPAFIGPLELACPLGRRGTRLKP